jgi:hypothetical protein
LVAMSRRIYAAPIDIAIAQGVEATSTRLLGTTRNHSGLGSITTLSTQLPAATGVMAYVATPLVITGAFFFR